MKRSKVNGLEVFEEDVHADNPPVDGVRPGNVNTVSDVASVPKPNIVHGQVGQGQLDNVIRWQVTVVITRVRCHRRPQLNHCILLLQIIVTFSPGQKS